MTEQKFEPKKTKTDFQLGLSININVNNGQNEWAKNVAKMANFRPKIGQDSTFAQSLKGIKW